MKKVNRREFIESGVKLAIFSSLMPLTSCAPSMDPSDIDWIKALKPLNKNGAARLIFSDGSVTKDGSRMRKGQIIRSGEQIDVAKTGEAVVELEDYSVIKLKNGARATFSLNRGRGGTIHLKKGAALSAITKRKFIPYVMKGINNSVGIRGTVFFTQILSDEDRQEEMIPQDATEYFCICNGSVDFLNPDSLVANMGETAKHHSSYFIGKENNKPVFKKAGFLFEHSDDEIETLIDRMSGEKHDKRWLDQYENYGM